MAITVDWATKIISVPQADCILVSGTLYRLPTKTVFRSQVIALASAEEGIWAQPPIDHNPDYTVFGITYAPKVEIINGYQVQFTPNSAWSVLLEESNNNIADVGAGVLVQNQVQVIPNNSAGLIQGSIQDQVVEGAMTMQQAMRCLLAAITNKLLDVETGTLRFRNVADTKDRMTVVTDANHNRTSVTRDLS